MLLDERRLKAFEAAISYHVKPQMRVLELGAGTGILSFLAARQGGLVECVERNGEVAAAAQAFLKANGCLDTKVIVGDAFDHLPEAPVDVVICEMLHAALLREQQIPVLASFKRRYEERFPESPLPVFIPEAAILAAQPVQRDFTFLGYKAPVPIFTDPYAVDPAIVELATPVIYSTFQYKDPLPLDFTWSGNTEMTASGEFSAMRFVTKNIVGIFLEENSTADWHNQYLIVPVPRPCQVRKGDIVRITFSHRAGGSVADLMENIEISGPSGI